MKHHEFLTGYKATNKDMQCRGFHYEIGKWYRYEGKIGLCEKGFHFCRHPSGPWSYYNNPRTRIFRVEAKEVIEEYTPGSDLKLVCRKIRLVEEIKLTGHWNTGHRNTGNWNTGHWNTGHGNTGNRNTGHWNTGDRNTGDRNTGHGNAADNSAGFFCQIEPRVISFDKQTKYTRKAYLEKYPEYNDLSTLLSQDAEFNYKKFKNLPGWTLKKCKALHQKHICLRRAK
jgi:hypothetical protein